MSVLILSLFNGILLFRQRTEQSVLYHVCPDAEGLGGTLNSALLKVGLAKKEMPCRLLVVFREARAISLPRSPFSLSSNRESASLRKRRTMRIPCRHSVSRWQTGQTGSPCIWIFRTNRCVVVLQPTVTSWSSGLPVRASHFL